MVVEIVIGILLLAIAVFVSFRILGSIAMGVLLIGLTLIASYLILGSLPDFKSIPILGQFIPKTGKFLDVFHKMDIFVDRDAQNNLLITVVNTGRYDLSEFKVFVDGQAVSVLNSPKDVLESGKATVIQVDWNKDFSEILVQSKEVSVGYKK